jgi:DNA-binding LacI/PurR family transcriptional regulator
VPAEQLGLHAANRLFDLVDGLGAEVTHTELPTELVVRESCGEHGPAAPPPLV